MTDAESSNTEDDPIKRPDKKLRLSITSSKENNSDGNHTTPSLTPAQRIAKALAKQKAEKERALEQTSQASVPKLKLSLSRNSSSQNLSGIPLDGTLSGVPSVPKSSKKRKKSKRIAAVAPSNIRTLHQVSELSFVYSDGSSTGGGGGYDAMRGEWQYEGQTVLYIIDEHSIGRAGGDLALHLRDCVEVTHASCERMVCRRVCDSETADGSTSTHVEAELQPVPLTYQHHLDPLSRILQRPPHLPPNTSPSSYEADSQSSRGGDGFVLALRAASAASCLGEVRIGYSEMEGEGETDDVWDAEAVTRAWNDDLRQPASEPQSETLQLRLRCPRQSSRVQLLTRLLTASEQPLDEEEEEEEGPRGTALKITLQFRCLLPPLTSGSHHLGGLHLSSSPLQPFLYTTTGIHGDHEGPRTYLPCFDTASVHHRSSHEYTVQVTAPQDLGMRMFGCGEESLDCTTLHPVTERPGCTRHDALVQRCFASQSSQLLATHVRRSTIWDPIPIRSFGFAVGPFLSLPDPELSDVCQLYLAPLYQRRAIHATSPPPLTKSQRSEVTSLHKSLTGGSSGIPRRALQLTAAILDLPALRTRTYTQIWIPGAHQGGIGSGSHTSGWETNAWLGGATLDTRLLPPLNRRLPFYGGGRRLQLTQARNAIWGWITAGTSLGGDDDTGEGYLQHVFLRELLGAYEKAHGGSGMGGSEHSHFYTKRWSAGSGLDCGAMDGMTGFSNLEEEEDIGVGGVVGALPQEERSNDEMWRGDANGTESHTSSTDEYALQKILLSDILEHLERIGPKPSLGWNPGVFGSMLCLTYLSSNACRSSGVGCGALDLLHPVNGMLYRTVKSAAVARVVGARAGVPNLIRVIRACFIATVLADAGKTCVEIPRRDVENSSSDSTTDEKDLEKKEENNNSNSINNEPITIPRFVTCVDEIMKKGGIAHITFIKSLRLIAGNIREPHLRGSLVDVARESRGSNNRKLTDPEGFPNSFIKGNSGLYLRVGSLVESVGGSDNSSSTSSTANSSSQPNKGIQLHVFAEPSIPKDGILFAGPIILRVVENEGHCREFVRHLSPDGKRSEWGTPLIYLHARQVTTAKQQQQASGAIEGTSKKKKSGGSGSSGVSAQDAGIGDAYTEDVLHGGGYQALELIRLTNRTPLLWCRVDPHDMYAGKILSFQPDACLSEQLFHDGDAAGQIEAMRHLTERPLRIQGSMKINTVYDVNVSELPVRVLGDCLRGTPALHSSLPHTPAMRAQAALSIAQWQNNKAPASSSRDDSTTRVGGVAGELGWIGLKLLIQYYNERNCSMDGLVLPIKYTRLVAQKADGKAVGGSCYTYLDTCQNKEELISLLNEAESIEVEEDEEYRVRSEVVTAIASIRAKDGMTPERAVEFLEMIIRSCDGAMLGTDDPEDLLRNTHHRWDMMAQEASNDSTTDQGAATTTNSGNSDKNVKSDGGADDTSLEQNKSNSNKSSGILEDYTSKFDRPVDSDLPYMDSLLVADAILALCHVHIRPTPPDNLSGKPLQEEEHHPIVSLLEECHRWLEWDLYREVTFLEKEKRCMSGVGCGWFSPVAPSAITALVHLALLRLSTCTATTPTTNADDINLHDYASSMPISPSDSAATATFYINIYDCCPKNPHKQHMQHHLPRSDSTRAAAAQAVACICCASDRLKGSGEEPLGLLSALEFLLDRILEPSISSGLRHTLAALMMDATTGKVCSMQRVATLGGNADFTYATSRFWGGPLGSSQGWDNGTALLSYVSEQNYPAATAVNDGARVGLKLLKRSGKGSDCNEETVVRVAKFATKLWRTINGEKHANNANKRNPFNQGVCALDGNLRCSLLTVWLWIWPSANDCIAIRRVQSWKKSKENTPWYQNLGVADTVMQTADDEKEASEEEHNQLKGFQKVIESELDRQKWRCDMAGEAYNNLKRDMNSKDNHGSNVPNQQQQQPLDVPLPLVVKDKAWVLGGWAASSAQQRREDRLDGGSSVSKFVLHMGKGNNE